MIIRTSVFVSTTAEQFWPLLTNSTMQVPGWFCLGLPRPVSCELPSTTGGVGAERRCISDRGIVVQKITHWAPPHQLQFEMVSTNHSWSEHVLSIREDFSIQPQQKGIKVIRTTTILATNPFKAIKELGFYLGLKRVHCYVFKNWRTLAECGSPF